MQSRNPPGAAPIVGHPIHRALAPFPLAFFVGALGADVVYWITADPLWSTMSSWLLLAGLIIACAPALTGLLDFVRDRSVQRQRLTWIHALGNGLAVATAALNFVFHVRDGYSAVVPAGPLLSMLVVLILVVTACLGWDRVHRQRVAIRATQAGGN